MPSYIRGSDNFDSAYKLTAVGPVTLSGTSYDFTNIPSWTKKITLSLNQVIHTGTAAISIALQLGTGGAPETTGYSGGSSYINGANLCGYVVSPTSLMTVGTTTASGSGVAGANIILALVNSTTNTWIGSGNIFYTAGSTGNCACAKSLTNALDLLRITTTNGTDTLSGTVSLLYEG